MPAIADDTPSPRSVWRAILRFCRRQPLGTFGLRAGGDHGGRRHLRRVDRALQPDRERLRRDDRSRRAGHHWLGTDQFGRDLLSRIIFGARTALIVGLSSAFVGGVAGLVLGVASAYFGGLIDLLLQRVFDVVMAFPLIIMALAVVVDLRHRRAQRHHRDHHPADPALRPRRALERAGDPRGALCRRRARLRLRPCADHPAPHGAERDGAVPDHADRVRRPGDPGRGVAVLSRPRRAGAGRRPGA